MWDRPYLNLLPAHSPSRSLDKPGKPEMCEWILSMNSFRTSVSSSTTGGVSRMIPSFWYKPQNASQSTTGVQRLQNEEKVSSVGVSRKMSSTQRFHSSGKIDNVECSSLTYHLWLRTWMPSATALVSFLSYTLIAGERLTVSTAFTAIALFSQLQEPMTALPGQFFAMLYG